MAEEKDKGEDGQEPAPHEEGTSVLPATQTGNAEIPIVGIGASAGGLETLEAFFDAMPEDSGVAFVVVTHHNAERSSLLPQLLRNHITMPVLEITAATVVEVNHIYLPLPGLHLALLQGVLRPLPAEVTHGVSHFPTLHRL